MPRIPPETLQLQLAETEEAMVTLRSSFRVETHLAKKWDVTPRQVRRWMAAVRKRWRDNATLDGRELKRDDMRETLAAILRTAMLRTETVKGDDGLTIYAQHPDGTRRLNANGFPIPMTRPKPDLQRALHACAQLRHLDALDEPYRAKLIIDAELDAMPDLKAMDAEGFEHLRELLTSVSPDKDLRKLAGGLFTQARPSDSAVN